jgi:signal transduction histidine kinase/ActR/RegA family two-component response regulator
VTSQAHGSRDVDCEILEVNPAQERMSGLRLFPGQTLRGVFPTIEDSLIETYARIALTGEPLRFERYVQATDRWFSAFASRVGGEGSRQVAVVFNNISARKKAEQLMRENEERGAFLLKLSDALRTLADPLQIQGEAARVLGEQLDTDWAYYSEYDAATSVATSHRDHGRRGAPTLVGCHPLTEFPGFVDAIRAGRTVTVEDMATSSLATDRGRTMYDRVQLRSVATVPVVKDGTAIASLAVADRRPRAWTPTEISLIEATAERTWAAVERARAEDSLRRTEARLRLALDAAMLGTFVWHVAEDRAEPDARMLRLFGLPPTASLNLASALDTLIHPDDRERYAAAVHRAVDAEGSGTLREDIRVIHPDRSIHWLAITAKAVFEGNPRRAVRLVGMATDVSDRKLTEEALRQSEATLREADRRKDEFLAVLAHELRNPLAPIRTGLEVIRLAGNAPDAIERARSMMERQVGHMVRLVDDLLDVSRITSGKMRLQCQPSMLATLVSNATEANRAQLAAKDIALKVDLPAGPVLLNVDPTRFVQVVSNLLHNAIKFTDRNGRVDITAEFHPPANDADGLLTVTVTDSGVGISQEMLPRVFDLFTQGDAVPQFAHAGLGIGLALARRLVEMHGGSLRAHSDGPGQGSAFTIRLPVSTGVSQPISPEGPADRPEITRRVVVIDDNEDAAEALAMLVSALGGEARVANDGEKGLTQVLAFRPDVVLLDIGMPGIDGYETCRRIRRAVGADVVVVALTGWGQEQDRREARDAGFDAHLIKPADPGTLERLLANAPPARDAGR